MTYLQAWKMKEKAKECIYRLPKNYYKLFPWMCERMFATNSGSSVELSYFDDGHFEQFFVAHSIYIQGFVRGCQPIIAIDSGVGLMVVFYFQPSLTMLMTPCSP